MIRIVSGGQTGVDRAALDAALARGVPCGGWCPRGRRAEDGALPARYPLQETPSSGYPQRTEWNVRDSDATLILAGRRLLGGTALTARLARAQRRPLRRVVLGHGDPREVVDWIRATPIATLNVAGPRESAAPGTYTAARAFLDALLEALGRP